MPLKDIAKLKFKEPTSFFLFVRVRCTKFFQKTCRVISNINSHNQS